jgi:erythritol transport system ATP-binding protein
MTIVMQAEQVSKSYGGVWALNAVDFTVEAGAVNVLIGENGAGKSTLMRILAGAERPDGGTLRLDGRVVSFGSVRDAEAAGVGIVFQELNLCPNLSVAENIFLTCGGLALNRQEERERARALMERLEHPIHPDASVGALKIGQQQIVEIAKALAADARVLILDEPTSSLSAAEVEVLFRVIKELTEAGVAVIYISHRLDELMRIGDFITVLRDGRLQAKARAADVSVDWIVTQMLGERAGPGDGLEPRAAGEVVLRAENVALARASGGRLLDGVTLEARSGEIVAVYGLLGSGRSELLETMAGARPGATGRVFVLGQDVSRLGVADRRDRRIALAPEDRQRDGLCANLSVGENLALSCVGAHARRGLIDKAGLRAGVAAMLERLGVKTASADAPIGSLSGGNQQKVLIGRQLMTKPAVLLLDEPGRGVDIGARAEIFSTIRRLAEDGLAVVFATSDMEEARCHADRVLVLASGRIAADLPAAQATDAVLVHASAPDAGSNDNAPRAPRREIS